MAIKKINYNAAKSSLDSGQLASVFSGGLASVNESEIKMLPIDQIKLDPKGDFPKIFPINEDDYDKIVESMKNKGFYKHQHLLVATILEENGTFIVDGHTRFKAAQAAGIDKVPVYEVTFETRKEALIFCYELQLNRRNLTDGQKLIAIEAMDSLKNPGRKTSDESEDTEETGKSAEKLGKQLGMSTRQVEKGRAILNSGDTETIEKVENNEMSINAGYNKVKGKTPGPKTKNDDDDVSDSHSDNDGASDALEDNSGNPGAVSFIQEHPREDPNKLSPEEDSDRTKERRAAYESGFADGFWKALVFTLSEVKKGKTPEEVYKDERISDLSSNIICNFELPDDAEDIINNF